MFEVERKLPMMLDGQENDSVLPFSLPLVRTSSHNSVDFALAWLSEMMSLDVMAMVPPLFVSGQSILWTEYRQPAHPNTSPLYPSPVLIPGTAAGWGVTVHVERDHSKGAKNHERHVCERR